MEDDIWTSFQNEGGGGHFEAAEAATSRTVERGPAPTFSFLSRGLFHVTTHSSTGLPSLRRLYALGVLIMCREKRLTPGAREGQRNAM